ncbi:MAG: helix-turn-helix transcriptional regulator [Candidatus Omnitrophota bacterium]
MNTNSFGKKLRKAREARGLTQKELADKVGISQRMMNYYENKSTYPPVKLIPKLCKLLKISSDELLGIKNLPKDELYTADKNLLRRFNTVKNLSERDKRNVFAFINALRTKRKSTDG